MTELEIIQEAFENLFRHIDGDPLFEDRRFDPEKWRVLSKYVKDEDRYSAPALMLGITDEEYYEAPVHCDRRKP
jgi:hypothetical protein